MPEQDIPTIIIEVVLGAAIMGAAISRFTKTDKDDAFFARLLQIVTGIKDKPKT